MAKLVVNPTSPNRREIALGRTLVSIGRDPSNDLVLPDAMVSRRHAVIESRGAQYYLRDCNSSNGSVVNGDRVSEKGLRDGDLVAIGSVRLLFREEAELTDGAKVVHHPSSPRFNCPACEAQYRQGDAFCRSCGGRLPEPSGPPKSVCAACGTAVLLPARFCSACGGRIAPGSEPEPAPEEPSREPSASAPAASASPSSAGPSSSGASSRSLGALAHAAVDPRPAPALEVRASPAPLAAPAASSPLPASPAPAPAVRPASAPAVPSSRPEASPRPVPAASLRPPVESAPFGLRVLAALLDLGLVALAVAVVLVPAMSYLWSREAPGPDEARATPLLLSLLVGSLAGLAAAAYYVWSWGVRGSTTGQRLLDLAVAAEDGRVPIGLGRAVVRLFGCLLCVLSLGLGFLLVPLTGSGLHDRVAGTRVMVRRAGSR